MDLYRYISFEEFMTLVTFKTLHFVKPTKWDDSYEGCAYQMMADETFRNDFFSHLYDKMTEKDIFIKTAGMLSNYCHFIFTSGNWYGQCWTYFESESDAFWRIYSYNKKSIRIKSSTEIIKTLLGPMYKIYDKKVIYDNAVNREDIAKMQLDGMMENKKTVEPFFHKQTAFSHENEYRFLITPLTDGCGNKSLYPNMVSFVVEAAQHNLMKINKDSPIVDKKSAINAINQVIEKTVPKEIYAIADDLDVNMNSASELVQDVLINPMADAWYVTLVEQICKENGIHCSGRSTLYDSVI